MASHQGKPHLGNWRKTGVIKALIVAVGAENHQKIPSPPLGGIKGCSAAQSAAAMVRLYEIMMIKGGQAIPCVPDL